MTGTPDAFLVLIALWALYTMTVHTFAGTGRVIGPMRGAELPSLSRGTLLVVWDVTTVTLLLLAGTIFAAAFSSTPKPLLTLALLQSLGFFALFLWHGRKELGAPIRLPQWLLFGPLGIALAASFTAHPAAVTASGLIATLALAHLLWAGRYAWPAKDQGQLAKFMLPEDFSKRLPGNFPSRTATLVVAVTLLVMAVVPLAIAAGSSWRWPARLVASVFLARGLFGLGYRAWSPRLSQQPFAAYNRVFYSPGCLLIGTIVALESV